MIAITEVHIGEETERRVLDVLRSGQLAQGPRVAELEELFASAHRVDHAIAVTSGTTALVASLQVLGIGPGDEVVTSPFTFVATLNAILESGATARFADIGDDYNVLPDSVGSCIGPSTRALLPVHLYGMMADMDPLVELADSAGLARMNYSPDVAIVPVPCAGRVDPVHVLRALQAGAKKVLILGCHDQACKYLHGINRAKARIDRLHSQLTELGLDPDCVRIGSLMAADAGRFVNFVTDELPETTT